MSEPLPEPPARGIGAERFGLPVRGALGEDRVLFEWGIAVENLPVVVVPVWAAAGLAAASSTPVTQIAYRLMPASRSDAPPGIAG
jgi:hypothetical protein